MKQLLLFTKSFTIYLYHLARRFMISVLKGEKLSRYSYRDISGGRKLAVLANGPSLNNFLNDIRNGADISGIDFSVMNYFANDDLFVKIKPKFYCFADPMFFKKDNRYEKVTNLFSKINNTVDWQMTIFIKESEKEFRKFAKINNSHIKIISVNSLTFNDKLKYRFRLYKSNYARPSLWTVAILNLYCGLNSGYKKIDLYGSDLTLLSALAVDDNNVLCNIETHFYEEKKQLKK
ncbi:MAG: hypothetical protein J6T70_14780, partial [Bacteroidales bacterium]|nr:hypothetical protein [Bacteroidales bacterium]